MFALSVAAWIVLASVITSVMYIWDKRRAQNDQRRVSERALLVWSAVGGWPGAMITGAKIRHKTQKVSYRIKFAICVLVNVALVVSICYFKYFRS